MKTAKLIFTLLLLPILCMAQSTLKLKGRLSDGISPITWGNVIIRMPNGQIVGGATSDQNGAFEINIQQGHYKITISPLGFSSWENELEIDKSTDLGLLVLSKKSIDLDEIVIQQYKKTVEQKIDRLVYSLENTISTIGGDALSAINTAPGVVVQGNSINILGKGTSRAMIDGRMIELSGEELNNFLRSIASADIKNIEVITNPPAKYDANGTGGIININLKKGLRNSWKNTSTVSYDQNKYGIYSLRNSFFYNRDKFRFSVSGNAKGGYKNSTENLALYFPNGLQDLKGTSKLNEENFSAKLALDYDISDRTFIGVQYLYDNNNPNFHSDIIIKNYTPGNELYKVLINNGFNNKYTGNQSYNAHLVSKLDTMNRKLSIDLDYFDYESNFDRDFTTKAFTPDMEFLSLDQSGTNRSNQAIDNKSIKVDMEYPLAFLNLSYGAKLSFTKSSSDIQYYNTITGRSEIDQSQSNRFEYQENNQAIYVNANKSMGDQFTVQLGLRLENIQTNGYSANANQDIQNDYLKLFPTLYLSYKQNENNSFNLNYGKRINRPRFDLLNPFRTYINSNSYSEGNPFLKPSISNNFEFSHSYKESLRTSVFLNFINDGYGVIFTSDPATNTQVITRENYYKALSYGIGESFSTDLNSWWQNESSLYLMGSKTSFISNIDADPMNGLQLDFSTSNTFSLSSASKLQLDFNYTAPYKSGLYTLGNTSSINMAFKQNISKKMQVIALANDILNTGYLKDFTSVVNGIKQVYNENQSSRFFKLSVVYNLGNNKLKPKDRNFGNEEEKRRLSK